MGVPNGLFQSSRGYRSINEPLDQCCFRPDRPCTIAVRRKPEVGRSFTPRRVFYRGVCYVGILGISSRTLEYEHRGGQSPEDYYSRPALQKHKADSPSAVKGVCFVPLQSWLKIVFDSAHDLHDSFGRCSLLLLLMMHLEHSCSPAVRICRIQVVWKHFTYKLICKLRMTVPRVFARSHLLLQRGFR